MNNDAEMRRKFAEIGTRYLVRTQSEIANLQTLITQLPTDTNAVLKQIEMIAHRIRGSGAVFGFDAISDAGAAIEALVMDAVAPDERTRTRLTDELIAAVAKLSAETSIAARPKV